MTKKKDATEKVAKKATVKKSTEIKAGKPAEVIDQTTQVTPVQVLSDEQLDNTVIQPGTVIVDPSVETETIKEEPVVNPDIPDTDHSHDEENLNHEKEEKHHKAKKIPVEDVKEPTRYGNGKEVLADKIEDTGLSRHMPPPVHGGITGGKNEWPR